MGVDLTLLVDRFPDLPGTMYPFIRLPLCRDYELWSRIEKAEPQKLNREIYYEDDDKGLVTVTDDSYSKALTFLTASELRKVMRSTPVPAADWGWETRAAWAYLEEIPPTMPVVLWWH